MTNTDKNIPSKTILIGLLLSLLGFLIFSVHDALVKYLKDYSVFQVIFFAMLFGYVPFSIARIVDTKQKSLMPNNLLLMLIRAGLIVSSLSFAFIAFTRLPLVEVYVILFCAPLLITILAIVFLDEKVQLFRWVAIFIGLLGIIIVLRPSVDTINTGHIFALAAALCGACSAIIARKVGNTENTAVMILFPLLANIVLSGIALYFVYQPMPLQDLSIMFLIGMLGLAGQYLVLQGYRMAPAAYVAPMQYSQIVWAMILGFFFFNESIDQWVVIGAVITIFSGVMIVWREASVSKNRPTLSTRNTRIVSAPTMKIKENDEEWQWL